MASATYRSTPSRLQLAEDLRVCLCLADERSPHFSSAAYRCHSALVGNCPEMSMTEARGALAAFTGLRSEGRYAAAETLRDVYSRHDQLDAAEVLDAWVTHPPSNTRSGIRTSAHALVDLDVDA